MRCNGASKQAWIRLLIEEKEEGRRCKSRRGKKIHIKNENDNEAMTN
jgi:hypothetical protein